jgi:hypothetical protein
MAHAFSQISMKILPYINGIHDLILGGGSDKIISELTVPHSRTGSSGSNGSSVLRGGNDKMIAEWTVPHNPHQY